MSKWHEFHMVDPSPWPIMGALTATASTMSISMWFSGQNLMWTCMTALISIMTVMYCWSKNIFSESSAMGDHSKSTEKTLKSGMILFITSEVFLFTSFFWAFFQSASAPNIEMAENWPPKSIKSFDAKEIPLLNTFILLSSGASITWSHHAMGKKNFQEAYMALVMTIVLGAIFTMFQMFEYWNAQFTMSDSSYGSTFFMATGFHGVHVMVGTSFLLICVVKLNSMEISKERFISFETAAWYWHFVDVVWLLLYSAIYWWGA